MDLVRFTTKQGTEVLLESRDGVAGFQKAGVSDRIAEAQKTFEAALADVSEAAETALAVLRDGALRPDTIEIEFGVRFSAESGAVIAKAAVEGNFKVKMAWGPSTPVADGETAGQATTEPTEDDTDATRDHTG